MSTDLNQPPLLADEDRIIKDFTEQYRDVISNLDAFIEAEDPNYVLALARSGPRLLERLEREGLVNIDPPVITEKALPFMDESEIKNSEFLVFDDILIAGTTIRSWLNEFVKRYEVDTEDVTVVTLAIDKESVGLFNPETLANLPEGEAQITLSPELDHAQISFNTFLKFDSRRRFQFSREVIHSLSCLNKPYDIDFALFGTIVDPELVTELCQQNEICDLTTRKQRNAGLERFSLIVPPELSYTFQRAVFHEPEYQTRISKLRIYYDAESGTAMFAPMFLFSMEEDTLTNSTIFDSDSFGYLNRIVDEVTDEAVNDDQFFESRFRLIWYLVSYLFGVYVNRNVVDEELDLFRGTSPEQHLHFEDLAYLFGEDVATTLLTRLQSNHERIVAEMAAIEEYVGPEQIRFEVEHPEEFTGETAKMYDDITPGESEDVTYDSITDNERNIDRISDENNLQGNLAIIFESLYSNREFIAQQLIGDIKGNQQRIDDQFPELIKRLENGFTVPQLAGILSEHTDVDFSKVSNNRRLSLAIDILVDKGEQISIFYRSEGETDSESATWQRAFRHGESAFILYDEFRELMYHAYAEILSDSSLWSVPIEKIAVIIWKSLSDKGLLDDLDKPGADDALWVRNTFLPFGHTLDIVNQPDSDIQEPEYEDIVLDSMGNEFVKWASSEEVDILEETTEQGRYTLSPSSARTRSSLPTPEPAAETPSNLRASSLPHTQRVRSLAHLLYWVHTKLDPTNEGKYLIGLTSCTDRKTYIHALREEFRTLFRSPEYKCELLLEALSDFTSEANGHAGQVSLADDELINELEPLHHSEKLKWPWKQAELKIKAWEEMDEIAEEIDNYFKERKEDLIEEPFSASSTPDLYNATSLPGFLTEVQDRHVMDIATGDTERFIKFTESYAQICIQYCQALWSFFDVYWHHFGDGEEHWRDATEDFNEKATLLERAVTEALQTNWDGDFRESIATLEKVSVPNIDATRIDGEHRSDTEQYLRSVLEDLGRLHGRLKEIYGREFDKQTFERRLEDVRSSIWKRQGEFVVYWSLENAANGDELQQELSDVQPEITTPNVCVAENARELRMCFDRIVRTVHADDCANVTLGIVAVDDVGERITIDDFGQVEAGNHLHLARQLAEYAEDFVESAGNGERAHSICISRGVRDVWGDVLPSPDNGELKTVAPSGGPEWNEELFDLKNQKKFIFCGWSSFVPTSTFLTEETTLDEFNE